jgi:hypothetical protein
MEMFNKKVLAERIGPLKKNVNLDALEEVERYVIKKCKELGIEHSYDVIAEEMPYFKTMGYTEYATVFMLQPLNLKMRTGQIMDAYLDNVEDVSDWAAYFRSNIESKMANKYQERKEDFDSYSNKSILVILPGSNKLKTNCCLNKLIQIAKEHKGDIYFKPHPITTHAVIGEIKDLFGEEAILPRDIDLYHFLQKAEKVYTTHISESALYATVLGKEVEPIDVWNNVHQGSFYAINSHLFDHRNNAPEWVNRTFSSPKSGLIHPVIDKDWKKKVDLYFEYIFAKRKYYKGWFLDQPKKNPQNKPNGPSGPKR